MKKSFFLFSLSIFTAVASIAQPGAGMIGRMKMADFNSVNTKAATVVKAIKPTETEFSSTDSALFQQIARGGQKQLAISQAVLNKATNPKIRLLAQSEVDEQTTLAEKLSEIAIAKGAILPKGPGADVAPLLAQVDKLSYGELDAFYLAQSGIKGHEELEETMIAVSKTATDETLKTISTVTLPVIRLHLTVSKYEQTMVKAPTTGG